MDLGIAGRKAVVCGSSRGIGKACALALAEAGASIIVNGRDPSVLTHTANEIRDLTGAEVVPVTADITTAEGQSTLLDACPRPDILITNNGAPPYRPYQELNREDILEGLIMNMVTPIELIKAVIDTMGEQRFGRIVNITSVTVKMGITGLTLSSGTRAGFTGFMSGIARAMVDRNVTINHLLPGYVDTEKMRSGMTAAAEKAERTVDEVTTQRLALIPAGRFAHPDEIGQTCAFLCGQSAGYITGQNIVVDGGLYNGVF